MADLIVGIYGGVDTHKDLHVAAVIDQAGRVLGTESFAASPAGYRRLEGWIHAFGPVVKVGIEGTSSYGVGLTRHLLGAGDRGRGGDPTEPPGAPPAWQVRHRRR